MSNNITVEGIAWVGMEEAEASKISRVRLTRHRSGKKYALSVDINAAALKFLGDPERIQIGFKGSTGETLIGPAYHDGKGTFKLTELTDHWHTASVKAYEKMVEEKAQPVMGAWFDAYERKDPGLRPVLVVPSVTKAEAQQGIEWTGMGG